MSGAPCPFCHPATVRIFHLGETVLGLWDAFPVAEGHALLVTRRHVASWFDATAEEQRELTEATRVAREAIERDRPADGFNIGVNIGAAGGQTVPHLHLHVIPRRHGDVDNPRGGVRYVIPAKANYSGGDALGGASVVRDAGDSGSRSREETDTARTRHIGDPATPATPGDAPHGGPLVSGDHSDPLLPHLLSHLDRASSVDLAVAFIMPSGIERIREHLRDLLGRGGSARILTGDYMDVTDPGALRGLLDLKEEIAGSRARGDTGEDDPEAGAQPHAGHLELRIFNAATTRQAFHPKVYLLREPGGSGVAFVGSSNLSKTALEDGIEWNYRIVTTGEASGFTAVATSFDSLFAHENTRELTHAWVDQYEKRRRPTDQPRVDVGEPEAVAPPPEPHEVQKEALAALAATREAGNAAGLVVLATGLGKTWLAAFDTASSPKFKRVLFVAHREEILAQAMATFRRIRPKAHLGMFTGTAKDASADVVFASVQTLGRKAHLKGFEAGAFDYIVMDEFHHASAPTYRRILDHFEPKFLLGLTATPERTDGGDLLGLCGENLVYGCDLRRGIELGLLSPFHYFGVPDEIDYANIPWRNKRFDPVALENALKVTSRAENAYEQWQKHAGPGARTIAFCCSRTHADFMADFFRERSVRAAVVHSGDGSDPRAASLEALRDGRLDVVFAVDMFNEGVDIPNIDAILMLRPTESRILWLQQFGRGLRRAEGKERLTVVDYIGNHRVFLNKPMALLDVRGDHRALQHALDQVESGEFSLPPGCEITYDLAAVNVLRGLLKIPKHEEAQALRDWYREFSERTGERPRASEAFHEGYNPRAAKKRYGSWLGLVREEGDLSAAAAELLDGEAGNFLTHLESTPMSKSFKMLVLLAMLNAGRFPGEIEIADLVARFARLAARRASLRGEVDVELDDAGKLRAYIEKNPIQAWTGGKGTGGTPYFAYADGLFRSTFEVQATDTEELQELARELADWRLAEYLSRAPEPSAAAFRAKVRHAGGKPILFLPDRDRTSGIPLGTQRVEVDGTAYEADFVKIAVNVMRKAGNDKNALPQVLREWFGPDAGLPGTRFEVTFECGDEGELVMTPTGAQRETEGLELWRSYARSEVPGKLGVEVAANVLTSGVVPLGDHLVLFVTLEKATMPEEHRYDDRFLSADVFQWQSQNSTRQEAKRGRMLRDPVSFGKTIRLFVREKSKNGQTTVPFVYCGTPTFIDWEGEKPITVQWRLAEAVPGYLQERMRVPATR